MEWTRRVRGRIDDLPDEERREPLNLLLEEATIDGENKVTLTLAIPPEDEADEAVVPIAAQETLFTIHYYSSGATNPSHTMPSSSGSASSGTR